LDRIHKCIDELEEAMTVLPHVEDDGSSECPFAGELYAKKEELEEEVQSAIERMQGYDADLEGEIQRRKTNLELIQTDENRLNLQETQDRYLKAEDELQRQCRHLAQDRDAISVVMARAQGVLKVSEARELPGGESRGRSPVAAPSPESPQRPSAPPRPAPLGQELGGLLSLGPLGQGQGSNRGDAD
jgi:hypothetical protein